MNRSSLEKNTRKLTRVGKVSLSVTIPRDLVVELGWKENQKITVKKHGQGLLIEDWRSPAQR